MAKKHPAPARGIYRRGKIYWLAIQRNGKRQFITLETSDFAEAVKRATMIRQAPELNESMPLRAEIDRFIAYKQRMNAYTRSTAVSKKNKLLLFSSDLPESASATNVTASQLQRFYDTTRQRTTDTTAQGYMMALQAFFRWAVEVERVARRNPVKDVKIAKSMGRARKNFCGYELRDKLIAEAPSADLRFILFCGFHAGLRFQEIVETRAFWFDLEAGLLHLRKTPTMNFKDREERTIPLTREFRCFLADYGMREPYMLKGEIKPGKSLYRYDFRLPFTNYMKAQGCEWITPHIMRHTFASLLVSAGESIYKVAVWLGDEVGTVQKHYGHLASDNGGIEKAFSMRKPSIQTA
jgi:integrase